MKSFIKLILIITNFTNIVKHINDNRINPSISIETILKTLLTAIIKRTSSMNNMQNQLYNNKIKHSLSTATVRRSLINIDSGDTKKLFDNTVKYQIDNENISKINGYRALAIDKTDIISSFKVDYDKNGKTTYKRIKKHKIYKDTLMTTLSTVGQSSNENIIIDFIIHPATKGELTAGYELIESLILKYKRYFDCIVGDALYANAPFVNLLNKHKLSGVFRIKNKQKSIKEALKYEFSVSKENGSVKVKGKEFRYWCKVDGINTTTSTTVKYYRFVAKNKIIWCATNDFDMPAETVLLIMLSRWEIENCVFKQLKEHYNMKHVYISDFNGMTNFITLLLTVFNLVSLYITKNKHKFKRPISKINVYDYFRDLFYITSLNIYENTS